MHFLGTEIRLELIRGNEETCLYKVDGYRFDVQELHFFETPLDLQAEDILRVTCVYDNSAQNQPMSGPFTASGG